MLVNNQKEVLKDDGKFRVFLSPIDIMNVKELDIYEQMVYMVLRSYVNTMDNTAFPSYNAIATRGRMSRQKAIDAMKMLVARGLIKKEVRFTITPEKKYCNQTNIYTVMSINEAHNHVVGNPMIETQGDFLKDDGKLRIFLIPTDIMNVKELDIYEQMVYMVLRSYVNAMDATAFPSYNTIAKRGRMSRRKVIYVMKTLVEKGLIKKEPRFTITHEKKIRNTSNLYTVMSISINHTHCVMQEKVGGAQRTSMQVPRVHQANPPCAPPINHRVHQANPPCAPYHNHLKELSLKEDDDNKKVFHLLKLEFISSNLLTKKEFKQVMKRVEKKKPTHSLAYARKALLIAVEQKRMQEEKYQKKHAETVRKMTVKRVQVRRNQNRKPVFPIVQPGMETITLSPEELERARELAIQLDEEREQPILYRY